MRVSTLRAAAIALGIWTAVAPAAAQSSAAAEALFDKGLAKLKESDYEAACPMLEESHRLDPKPGVLFTLAACEAKRGRIATAITRYEDYLEIVAALPAQQRTRQVARERAARKERDALEAQVPTLTVVVPASVPSHIVVKRDGEPMGKPSFGVPLPVDPGEHLVTVHSGSKDKALVTERVLLAPGEKRTVELPGSYREPAEPTPAGAGGRADRGDADGSAAADGRLPLAWPIAAFAVGVTGVGVGTVFGLLAMDRKRVVDDECNGSQCQSEDGRSAGESGKTFGTVSTIGFVAGGVGVAAGITLLFVRGSQGSSSSAPAAARAAAPGARACPSAEPHMAIGPGGALIGARGRF